MVETASHYRIETANDLDGLKPHAAAWNRLAASAPQELPVLSHAWVTAFVEYQLESDHRWFCLFAYDGDRLVGVLPVIVAPHCILGFNRPYLRTPQSHHTYSSDFLVEQGREDEIIPALISHLDREAHLRHSLFLRRIPESSPTLKAVKKNVHHETGVIEFNGRGSVLKIEGIFKDYLASLSANFKGNLRKANHKIERLSDVRAQFLDGTETTGVELDTFLQLEASGWKGEMGSAIEKSPSLAAFYRRLTEGLARLGWLEWHFLHADGKVIAGQMATKLGRTLTVFKIAYDESYSWCSPGNILFERTVERAYRSGDTDSINCLTDMPWHHNWHMDKIDYYDLWIYPHHLLPFAFSAIPKKANLLLHHVPGIIYLWHQFNEFFKGEL